jgi:hypothetical protein
MNKENSWVVVDGMYYRAEVEIVEIQAIIGQQGVDAR